MAESSFDIVSEINQQEMVNAVDQARREIGTRFDFKGTDSSIDHTKTEVVIHSNDEGKLEQVIDVLQTKMIKRGISIKALKVGKIENASGATVRQKAELIAGIEGDVARKINKIIKDSNIKVKTQTLDNRIRVTAKSRDELQEVIQLLKTHKEVEIPLQFTNYK